MEAGFRTPLLDFFRRGDVAHDVRLVAAQGALTPRGHDGDQPIVDMAAGPDIPDDKDDPQSAMTRLAAMTVPQRVSRATKGTREERAILIRDPNKMVGVAVMSSPK